MTPSRKYFQSRSDSTIANGRLSVTPSVRHQNPSASQNCSYHPSSHRAYQPLRLSTIEPINHGAHQPLSLSTIKLIDHQAYQPSSPLTIKPVEMGHMNNSINSSPYMTKNFEFNRNHEQGPYPGSDLNNINENVCCMDCRNHRSQLKSSEI